MTESIINRIYSLYLQFPKITTDTRKDLEGSIFFALKGGNFDGNKFAKNALDSGAEYAVIDDPKYQFSEKCILVPDCLDALQKLAKYHRSRVNIPVIGITGSNGKTTTKELVKAVLSSKYKSCSTEGNLNNHIGVPLTVLRISSEDEIAIVEMGANHIGEIRELCEIAQPTHGIITNIGKAHIEGFGSFEGIKKAKSELYDYLRSHNGIAFVNSSDSTLMDLAEGIQVVNYGEKASDFCQGEIISLVPKVSLEWHINSTESERSGKVNSHLFGNYNFINILSSVCIAAFFGVESNKINNSLSDYEPKNNRSQLIQTKFNKIILDAYNANPSSMSAAIQTCSRNFDKDVYFILGDMFELGNESYDEHKKIVDLLLSIPTDEVLLIGKHFMQFEKLANFRFFENREQAKAFLQDNPPRERVILIKGSRGMELEKLLPLLP